MKKYYPAYVQRRLVLETHFTSIWLKVSNCQTMSSCLHLQWILEAASVDFKADASRAHSILSEHTCTLRLLPLSTCLNSRHKIFYIIDRDCVNV